MIAWTPAVEAALIVLCMACGIGMFGAVAILARGAKRKRVVYRQRLPR